MPTSSASTSPAELFSSLLEARQHTEALQAEEIFLRGLPRRLGLWGSLFAYGVATGKPWAKWVGGAAIGWMGVEYFAARRRAAVAAQARTPQESTP